MEIRWSDDHLISTMGFPILWVRWHLYIESGPRISSNTMVIHKHKRHSHGTIITKTTLSQWQGWAVTSTCLLSNMLVTGSNKNVLSVLSDISKRKPNPMIVLLKTNWDLGVTFSYCHNNVILMSKDNFEGSHLQTKIVILFIKMSQKFNQ